MNINIWSILVLSVSVYCIIGQSPTKKQVHQRFNKWKQAYQKKFLSDEELYREILFAQKLAEVEDFNKHNLSYKKDVNLFATMNQNELKKVYLNPLMSEQQSSGLQSDFINTTMLKSSYLFTNWKTLNGVSPVKDQGSCGSCWAFSVIASIQSQALIKNKTLIDLSEQQLVDCAGNFGNQGCNGGWPSYGLNFVLYNGISLQSEYPYTAKQQTCKKNNGSFQIRAVKYSHGCPEVQMALKLGPQNVAVDASQWFDYKSGIFNNCSTALNHAVLLVGVTSGQWIIKNSWGTSWGQSGFIRLALGNTCGLCSAVSSFPS